VYTQGAAVITRRRAGDTLLIPVTQVGVDLQKVYLLNETAAAVWQLLEAPHSLDEMVSALQETYEAPEQTIRHDVEAVLEDLMARSFVTVQPADG